MIEIKVNCKGTNYFSLSELNILQDTKDFKLKELSEENLEKLKNSIIKNGFWFPFFVWHCKAENKWYYTDGTQRYKVLTWMQKSGEYKLPEKYPCVEIFAKDKKEAAKAILTQSTSYGKITEKGLYDFLNEYDLDFADLKTDLELSEIDLNQFEINFIIDNNDEKENDIPEVPTETDIKIGDMFELGNNKLLCGDSTDIDVINRIVTNEIDIVFTDPPYDMDFNLINKCFNNIKKYADVQFWMGSDKQLTRLAAKNFELFSHYFIHDRIIAVMLSGSQPMSQHTLIAKFKNKKIKNLKDGFSTLLKIKSQYTTKEHKIFKMGKNIQLPGQFIKHYCTNAVLDIFGGYGSTLIAAEKYKKKCFMIEINPYYCDLIIQRFENYTGIKAKQIN